MEVMEVRQQVTLEEGEDHLREDQDLEVTEKLTPIVLRDFKQTPLEALHQAEVLKVVAVVIMQKDRVLLLQVSRVVGQVVGLGTILQVLREEPEK